MIPTLVCRAGVGDPFESSRCWFNWFMTMCDVRVEARFKWNPNFLARSRGAEPGYRVGSTGGASQAGHLWVSTCFGRSRIMVSTTLIAGLPFVTLLAVA